MTSVLVLHPDHTSAAAEAAARAVARIHGLGVTEVHLPGAGDVAGRSARARSVLETLRPSLTVVGTEPEDTTLWSEFARTAPTPVLLVPARSSMTAVKRVLLPLDGTSAAAAAVPVVVDLLAAADVELIALHVFDAATVPPYWDHAAHSARIWEEEFLRRHCPRTGARLEVRTGDAGTHVLDVATEVDADVIALGWSQRVDAGHAAVVRGALSRSTIPVLLVPVGPAGAGPSPVPTGIRTE